MSEHPPTQPLPLITDDEDAPGRLVRPLLVLRRWADEYRAHRREHRTDTGPSIWEPIHLGIAEDGRPVRVPLIYRNMLLAGEPARASRWG